MKVWITKYVLSNGIIECEGELCEGVVEAVCVIGGRSCLPMIFHGKGVEWHESLDSAIVRANEIRNKRIESLYKQIEKLTNMVFEVHADFD